jgi:hypothetical protein
MVWLRTRERAQGNRGDLEIMNEGRFILPFSHEPARVDGRSPFLASAHIIVSYRTALMSCRFTFSCRAARPDKPVGSYQALLNLQHCESQISAGNQSKSHGEGPLGRPVDTVPSEWHSRDDALASRGEQPTSPDSIGPADQRRGLCHEKRHQNRHHEASCPSLYLS